MCFGPDAQYVLTNARGRDRPRGPLEVLSYLSAWHRLLPSRDLRACRVTLDKLGRQSKEEHSRWGLQPGGALSWDER